MGISFIFHSIFRAKQKPQLHEQTGPRRNSGTPDSIEPRASKNSATDQPKAIEQRKPVSLAASLKSIWNTLKYRSELEKAASDCRKFLASISEPNLDWGTVTPLCVESSHPKDDVFKELFRKTINDTIEKFVKDKKKICRTGQIQMALARNLAQFGEHRKANYRNAFEIARAYRKTLAAFVQNKPAIADFVSANVPNHPQKSADDKSAQSQ